MWFDRTRSTRNSWQLRQAIITSAAGIVLLLVGLNAQNAGAGCFDCLFGRSPQPVNYPYSANYPVYGPVTSTLPGYSSLRPVTAPVYGPTTSGAFQVQRPAYGTPAPYTQQLVPIGSTTTVGRFDNPSVYSGQPVGSATSYYGSSAPITTGLGGGIGQATPQPAGPATSFRPMTPPPAQAFNAFPPSTGSQSYQSLQRVPIAETLRGQSALSPITTLPSTAANPYTAGYPAAINQQSVAPTTYVQPFYVQTVPSTVPLTQPRWTFGSGLRRFFNSMLGRDTRYVSSYYRAPITYYRPMTAVDPTVGTTVTVQQPCSSYVQQLQRTPYNSFQPLATPPTSFQPVYPTIGDMTCQSDSMGSFGSSLPPSSTPPSFVPGGSPMPLGGIGQVSGESFPGDSSVTPIPSTDPGVNPNASDRGNTSPLVGNDEDLRPMAPPQIESQRVTPEEDDVAPFGTDANEESSLDEMNLLPPASSDSDADIEDEPAIRLDPPVSNLFGNEERFTSKNTPGNLAPGAERSGYSRMRPIGIPEGSRFSTGGNSGSQNPSVNSPAANQPAPLPPLPAADSTQDNPSLRGFDEARYRRGTDLRLAVPVREATIRQRLIQPVAAWETTAPSPATQGRNERKEKPRDTGGWVPTRTR